MFTYSNIPILLSLLFSIVVSIVALLIIRVNRNKNSVSQQFIDQLNEFNNKKAREDSDKTGIFLIDFWINQYGKKLIQARMFDGNKYTKTQVASMIFFICIVIYGIISLLVKNLGLGIIPTIFFLVGVNWKSSRNIEKHNRIFQEQIPFFLSLIKSNVQAGDDIPKAFISAIDETDEPLYSELISAKYNAETSTLEEALRTLREETKDETIKFLCGCIEVANKTGINLEPQLEVLEEIVENKRILKNQIEIAKSENMPVIYVSSVLLPGIFLMLYFTNTVAREFWFNSTLSWVVFFSVIILFSGGMFLTKLLIDKTAKF